MRSANANNVNTVIMAKTITKVALFQDLMVSVFGDAGKHARSAVGMANLPLNFAVEVDGIFEID